MKNAFVGLAGLALLALAGCNESTPGGPGAANPPSGPVVTNPPGGTGVPNTNPSTSRDHPIVGQKEGTFKLNPPMLTTTVHQGETKDVAIGIDRGTNFDGDVTLNFSQEPKGVTVDAPNPVIKAGD